MPHMIFDAFRRHLKVGQTLLLLFQILSITLVIIFIIFVFSMNSFHTITEKILKENVSSIRAAYNVKLALMNQKGLKANYLLRGDKKWLKQFDSSISRFRYWHRAAHAEANTDIEKRILQRMGDDFEKYLWFHNKIVSLNERGENDAAINLLLVPSSASFDAIIRGCDALIAKNEELIDSSQSEARRRLRWSRGVGFVIVPAFILLGIMLGIITTNSILKPIREMEKNSAGVVSVGEQEAASHNEIERLRHRFESMITTLKANQEKMIHSEKRAVIADMAAGMSHEINNPIGIILGFSERLLHDKHLKPAQRIVVTQVYREAKRCKLLLGEMLNFARIPVPRFQPTKVGPLIKEVVRLFSLQEVQKRITYRVHLSSVSTPVNIDPGQIKQVLINLIRNASEAIEGKGVIVVSGYFRKRGLVIDVSDNGPGIPIEKRGLVFKPFYSTKAKGIGLGLSLCQDIMLRHNGRIEVLSDPGEGTTFSLTFPKESNT